MNIKVVIGANYGDEGKGRITNHLATSDSLVILNNGGPQRGHTVQLDDGTRHVFHHFGSGTLKGADTFITHQFYANPILFCKEYVELVSLMHESISFPNVFIDKNCCITTPYEMIANQIICQDQGLTNSCGLGIFETSVHDNSLYIKDFVTYDLTQKKYIVSTKDRSKLNQALNLRYANLNQFIQKMMTLRGATCDPANIQKHIDDYFNEVNVSGLNKHFIDDFEQMVFRSKIVSFYSLVDSAVEQFQKYDIVIVENGQGLLLDAAADPVYGTPSRTGVQGAYELLDTLYESCCKDVSIELIYVTRPYLTRHGDGPMSGKPIMGSELEAIRAQEFTNIPNQWQGAMRFATMDSREVQNRIEKDSSYLDIPHKTTIAFNWMESGFCFLGQLI